MQTLKGKLPKELVAAFRARPVDANKYTVGTVLVVGGSERYAHAPVIAALGARAAGAGLVRLAVPDASRAAAGALVPEATFIRLSDAMELPRAEVMVIGMGLGTGDSTAAIMSQAFTGTCGRLVLDADALTMLAKSHGGNGADARLKGRELILTPHEGEAAKLLGWTKEQVVNDRMSAAKELVSRYGATVVLKGKDTLVLSSDGRRVYVNHTGNPFMALGGMGDLLAGTMGARWAYLKEDPFLVAASSVWLHGAASDAVIAASDDPSIVNTAAALGSLRAQLDR